MLIKYYDQIYNELDLKNVLKEIIIFFLIHTNFHANSHTIHI